MRVESQRENSAKLLWNGTVPPFPKSIVSFYKVTRCQAPWQAPVKAEPDSTFATVGRVSVGVQFLSNPLQGKPLSLILGHGRQKISAGFSSGLGAHLGGRSAANCPTSTAGLLSAFPMTRAGRPNLAPRALTKNEGWRKSVLRVSCMNTPICDVRECSNDGKCSHDDQHRSRHFPPNS